MPLVRRATAVPSAISVGGRNARTQTQGLQHSTTGSWEASLLAREFAKNWFSQWSDDDFCSQPLFDKAFYVVLCGQRAVNNAGVQPINFTRWRRALRDGDRMPTESTLKAALARMEQRRYVFTDEDTGEVLIRAHIRRDEIPRQPNVLLSALRFLAAFDSPKFAAVMAGELGRIELPEVSGSSDYSNRLRSNLKQCFVDAHTHLETLSKGLSEPFPEPFTEGLPRPAEMQTPPEPFQEGLSKPPVVVEVEVVKSPLIDGYVGEVDQPDADAVQARPDPDRNGPPPPRCPDHINDEHPPACGACGGYRRARERWDQQQATAVAEARSADLRAAAALRDDAIAACHVCDPDGRLPSGVICSHNPKQADTNRRGAAAVRAALAKEALIGTGDTADVAEGTP